MQNQDIIGIIMEDTRYKKLYDEFKDKIQNDDNQDQIVFIRSKTRQVLKIVDKIASKEDLLERDIFLAKVYVFSFYYRLIEFEKQAQEKGIASLEDLEQVHLDFIIMVADHFMLSSEELEKFQVAFSNFDEPPGSKSLMGIKLGHDAIVSIFSQKKLEKVLNSVFSELEFYFPVLKSKFFITNELIDYISKTKFYTDYAISKYLSGTLENKKRLILYVQDQIEGSSLLNNKHAMTMMKTSSRNQVDLTSIADKKAGIMITVNSILLTLLIPMFASYMFDFSRYIMPLTILTVTCGLTILLATLATRPTATKGKVTSENIHSGQKSIFYYKNFSKMSKNEFISEVRELITRDRSFEKSVFADLYDSGKDLDWTFKQLRWCYTIFASGIFLTMVTFLYSIFFVAA